MADECGVCLSLPEGEVHQCNEGHCYCVNCWNRLHEPRRCPECRQPLPPANRNRVAERAIAALEASCEHCGEATTRGGMAAHLLVCPQRLNFCTTAAEQAAPHPQVLIFDTNMYKEGRPCIHVRACETSSSACTYGDWVEARALLWRDQEQALHVTIVKVVSKRCTSHPRALDQPLTAVSRHRLQDGPPLVFCVATHHFAEKDDWDLVVFKKGESTHAEVCSFARCAALRNLFVQRLRVGARTGDDRRLTPLLWPCAGDLWYMLNPLMLLRELGWQCGLCAEDLWYMLNPLMLLRELGWQCGLVRVRP